MGVIEIVNRANQRGGRMLSVLDLVDAGTLTIEQTAWLLDRILGGSSWFVGARPGGAGKTTVMAALLAMLPEGQTVHLAARGTGWERAARGECVVAYEISPGSYEAYLWGGELARFAALGERGVRIVSNLHADTLEQAHDQVVRQNEVPARHFERFAMFLPISLARARGTRRMPRVRDIRYHDGGDWHTASPTSGGGRGTVRIEAWLGHMLGRTERTVEGVRAAWIEFLRPGTEGART